MITQFTIYVYLVYLEGSISLEEEKITFLLQGLYAKSVLVCAISFNP